MGFFEHKHYWRSKTAPNTVMASEASKCASSVILIEDCHCGAIRQIEYSAGQAPRVFVTLTPMGTKP